MNPTCSFCDRPVNAGDRLIPGSNGAALCRACATNAVDFFGTTDKMDPEERPTALYPLSGWDKRDASTLSQLALDRRR